MSAAPSRKRSLDVADRPPAKKRKLDETRLARNRRELFTAAGHYAFTLTISPTEDFTKQQLKHLVVWHQRFPQAIIVAEDRPNSGVEHYHTMFTGSVKLANSHTKSLERLFTKENIPWSKGVTIKIKSPPEPLGWFSYMMKEVTEGKPLILLKGWKRTWIDEVVKSRVKKTPHNVLTKDVYIVSPKLATKVIIKYASANNMTLDTKEGFCRCVARMMKDSYQFDNMRVKWTYAQVSAQVGREDVAYEMMMGELRFL